MSKTFKQDILDVANGEPILAIKFDDNVLNNYYGKPNPRWEATKHLVNKLCTWEELSPFLDYEYDCGYGSMDCHNIVAWTATKVIYIHEYDGSTSVVYVDRNPT